MCAADMPWRDPSRLTDADKARLDKLTERQANRLDVTSDAHEYVWGFRGNTPEEEHREKAGWASDTRHTVHQELTGRGHAMSWHLRYDNPRYATTWDGECGHCGAGASARAGFSTVGNLGKDARNADCSGPGTAWQNDLVAERQRRGMDAAIGEYGRAVKDIDDRAWLAGQGLDLEAGE